MYFPEIVYKYRFWDNDHLYHKNILVNREVFFASPISFEDKLDCKNLTRYDLLTDEEIYNKYLIDSHTNNFGFTEVEHKNFAENLFKNSILRDKTLVTIYMEQQFQKLCNRLGVLSLTEKNNLAEMWVKYSGNHTGICIGFDSNVTFNFFGGGGKVNYYETLPTIYPRPIHTFDEQIFLQVFSKEVKWRFEEEYRTLKLFPYADVTNEMRTISLPKEAIKEVIFGANMSDENKNEIIVIVTNNLPHVHLKQAFVNEDHTITINEYI